jgi:hypothetical protein
VTKHEPIQFNLYSTRTTVVFEVHITLFHGRYLPDLPTMLNMVTVTGRQPSRGELDTTKTFVIIQEPTLDTELSRNMPADTDAFFVDFAGVVNQSYPFAGDLATRVDPRAYWTSARSLAALTYFPYFSRVRFFVLFCPLLFIAVLMSFVIPEVLMGECLQCEGFGGRIPIFGAFEDPNYCDILPRDRIVPISPFNPGSVRLSLSLSLSLSCLFLRLRVLTRPQSATADRCSLELTCQYDETDATADYWFRSTESPFSFIKQPISISEMTTLPQMQSFFGAYLGTSDIIPVESTPLSLSVFVLYRVDHHCVVSWSVSVC